MPRGVHLHRRLIAAGLQNGVDAAEYGADMTEAWIIDAVRSPRGKGKDNGALHDVHPQRILAQVLNALQAPQRLRHRRRRRRRSWGAAPAAATTRWTSPAWPRSTPAGRSRRPGVTLNRFCGSGQQAVNFAAMGILAGFQDLVVGRWRRVACRGRRRCTSTASPPTTTTSATSTTWWPRASRPTSSPPSRASAARSATSWPSTARTGPRSPSPRAASTSRSCRSSTTTAPSPSTTTSSPARAPPLADLAKLTPSFAGDGWAHDRGGSRAHHRRDRAAGLPAPHRDPPRAPRRQLLGRRRRRRRRAARLARLRPGPGHEPRAKITMTAVAGNEPVIMLTAPGPAADLVLEKAGMTFDDIDLIEVNEAFAAVRAEVPPRHRAPTGTRCNVNGGAMALGHPIGATGGDAHRHPARRARAPRPARPAWSRCAPAAAWAPPPSSNASDPFTRNLSSS